ncbi:hypothetical protein V2W45_1470616 [Cenococcum geophilum]
MANLFRLEIIKMKPIREGLNDFRISSSLDFASRGTLCSDLLRLLPLVDSDNFNIKRFTPLLKTVLNYELDKDVWGNTIATVIDSFANLSEYRKYINDVLKEELSPLYMGIPGLYKVFFREVEGLKEASAAIFKKCKEGDNLLYVEGGWRNWPKGVKEYRVLKWFNKLIILFLDFIKEYRFVLKLYILILRELKSNLNTNIALKAWFNLGKYIREINKEQLGFNPTILILDDGKRYIEIRLILNKLIKRARYIAKREKEGKLLYKILEKGVVNIARYYYYKTIYGLDIIKATNYKLEGLIIPLRLARVFSRKRSSSYSALLPPGNNYKKPLYKASSWATILTILEGGIKGYESLYTIKAFMAIGVLLGKKHSFRHNLESLGKDIAKLKLGLVGREGHFLNYIAKVNRLRKWEKEDRALYS